MTAPESSPKPADKALSAEAIAREYLAKIIEGSGLRYDLRVAEGVQLILEAHAAIQRGDGQTKPPRTLTELCGATQEDFDRFIKERESDEFKPLSTPPAAKPLASREWFEKSAKIEGDSSVGAGLGTPPAAKPNETSGATPNPLCPRTDAEWQSYEKYSDDHFRYRMVRYTFTALMEDELNRVRAELNAVRAAGAEGTGLIAAIEKYLPCLNLDADRNETYQTENFSSDYVALIKAYNLARAAKSTPGVDAVVEAIKALEFVDMDLKVAAAAGGDMPLDLETRKKVASARAKLRAVKQEQIGGAK